MSVMKRLSVAFLTVFVCVSGATIEVSADDSQDHVAKIAEGIYSYSPGNHYYSMFVVTSDGVVAIESVNSEHATGMLEAIRTVTDQPVKYLLHSHNHWDHSSGGQVFKDAGAMTVAHAEAYEWMDANPGRDMALPTESWSGSRKDIEVGGTTIELHYLGMNHGLGMTIFLLPQQKVAYIADTLHLDKLGFRVRDRLMYKAIYGKRI